MAWGKAGSTTLSSGSDTITLSGMTASKFNMIIGHSLWSTFGGVRIVCNNDTTNQYCERRAINNGTDGQVLNTSNIDFWADNTKYDSIHTGYFSNINGEEKLFIGLIAAQGSTAVSVLPDMREVVGKYIDSSQITRLDFDNENPTLGDILTDSNFSVLGSNVTTATAQDVTVTDGAIFYETDTNKEYVLYNNTWTEV